MNNKPSVQSSRDQSNANVVIFAGIREGRRKGALSMTDRTELFLLVSDAMETLGWDIWEARFGGQ